MRWDRAATDPRARVTNAELMAGYAAVVALDHSKRPLGMSRTIRI